MNFNTIEFWSMQSGSTPVKHMEVAISDVDLSKSYILSSATGLDPQDIGNQFYGVATDTDDASDPTFRFFDRKPKSRVATFKIRLNPQYSVGESFSSLRADLYKMIARYRTGLVEVRFVDQDGAYFVVVGNITRFDCDIFVKDPSCEISIECSDPFFRSPERVDILDLPDTFVTESLITFNDYVSTAPHGLYIVFDINEAVDPVYDPPIQVFSNLQGGANDVLEVIDYIGVGEQLHIRSDFNNREIYKLVGGGLDVRGNMMDKVTSGSIWPMVFPGSVTIGINIDADISVCDHYITHWGV